MKICLLRRVFPFLCRSSKSHEGSNEMAEMVKKRGRRRRHGGRTMQQGMHIAGQAERGTEAAGEAVQCGMPAPARLVANSLNVRRITSARWIREWSGANDRGSADPDDPPQIRRRHAGGAAGGRPGCLLSQALSFLGKRPYRHRRSMCGGIVQTTLNRD